MDTHPPKKNDFKIAIAECGAVSGTLQAACCPGEEWVISLYRQGRKVLRSEGFPPMSRRPELVRCQVRSCPQKFCRATGTRTHRAETLSGPMPRTRVLLPDALQQPQSGSSSDLPFAVGPRLIPSRPCIVAGAWSIMWSDLSRVRVSLGIQEAFA